MGKSEDYRRLLLSMYKKQRGDFSTHLGKERSPVLNETQFHLLAPSIPPPTLTSSGFSLLEYEMGI